MSETTTEREVMDYDVIIVGAGPAGLACAIRLKQLKQDLMVAVIEKSAESVRIFSPAQSSSRAHWMSYCQAGRTNHQPYVSRLRMMRFPF